MTNFKSGVYFIISHLEIATELPFEIIPEHFLRKARDREIEIIEEMIKTVTAHRFGPWIPYNGAYRKILNEFGSEKLEKTDILKKDWKYWVVAYNGYNTRLFDIIDVGLILPFDFTIGFTMKFSEEDQNGQLTGFSFIPDYMMERYSGWDVVCKPPSTITAVDLEKIQEVLKLIKTLPEKSPEASINFKRAISRFDEIMKISRKTDLVVVGLFSLIEFLLAHKPRNESIDSITNQLVYKMILLRKRYARSINTNNYFLDSSEDKIWKKLYSYRSSIAHGTTFNFDKEGAALKNKDSAITFLEENIKELLLLLLREPDLMLDIRNC